MLINHRVIKKTLSKGTKLFIADVPNAPTFRLEYVFRAGFRYIDSSKFELPHLLEHLAFRGNKVYPDTIEFLTEIDRLGVHQNAYTSFEEVGYTYSGRIDALEDVVNLSLIQITKPLFKEEAISEEKETVKRELERNVEQDGYRLGYKVLSKLNKTYEKTLKERIDLLESISRDDILSYYARTHTCANLEIWIGADLSKISEDKLITEIEKGLEDMKEGEVIEQILFTPEISLPNIITIDPNIPTPTMYELSIISTKMNFQERLIMSAVSYITTKGLAAKFFQDMRQKGITYSVHSGFYYGIEYSSFEFSEKVKHEDVLRFTSEIIKELKRLITGNFTEIELDRVKGMMKSDFIEGYEIPVRIIYWYKFLNDKKIEFYNPEDNYYKIDKLSREEISKTLKKYLKKDNILIAYTTNKENNLDNELLELIEKELD